MAGLENFSRRIKLRAEEIERNSNKAVKAVALAVDQAVVLGTPVDTGLARSKWEVGRGGPKDSVSQPFAPGSRLGIGEQANAAAALAAGRSTINARKLGEDLYITNNTEYIEKLNSGTSRQAPRNFVELAVLAGIDATRKRRLLRGN